MNDKVREIRFWPEDFYLKDKITVCPNDNDKGVRIAIGEEVTELTEYEIFDLGKWIALHINKPNKEHK